MKAEFKEINVQNPELLEELLIALQADTITLRDRIRHLNWVLFWLMPVILIMIAVMMGRLK